MSINVMRMCGFNCVGYLSKVVGAIGYNYPPVKCKTEAAQLKMRFNDKEIAKFCNDGSAINIEGVLHHMKPQGNDWSDWYQQPSFKERTFKLVCNLLFYYRVNETEPLGVLVLENAQVAYERPQKGIFYAFSITFADGKHIFACRCEEDVNKWVKALKAAPYEHWRSQFIILKTKLGMRNGLDPVLNYMNSKNETPNPPRRTKNKATFYAEVKSGNFYESKATAATTTTTTTTVRSKSSITVGNLIDL